MHACCPAHRCLETRRTPAPVPAPPPPAPRRQLPKPATICDGLEARLGSLTWPAVRDLVDDVITLSEEEVVAAMQLVFERMKVRPCCQRAWRRRAARDGLGALPCRQRGRRSTPAGMRVRAVCRARRSSRWHRTDPVPQAQVVVEPSGAAGVAAALSPQLRARHPGLKRVAVILCGGNVDLAARCPDFWARWLQGPPATGA